MKIGEWVRSNIDSSRELVDSGLEGANLALREALHDEPVSSAVGRTMRDSWRGLAVGAAIGATVAYVGSEEPRHRGRAAVGFLLGAVVGVSAYAVWQSRSVMGAMAQGAAERVGTVRDAHWLAKHPVPYG